MRGAISKRTAGWAAIAATAATLPFGGVAFALGAGGFSVRPAHSNPADAATRAYFKPLMRRGGSFSDSVVVSNTGSAPLELLTYPVDGLTGQTTGTVYANHRDRIRKAGAWVRLGISRITVAAGQQASVPFTVRVPIHAKAGDHVAGIAFENANPSRSGGGFRITEIIREVVGVQIRVPGKAAPHLTLGTVKLKALPGTPLASAVVGLGNSGLILCRPTLSVSLSGPHGYRRAVLRNLDTVLPGDAIAYPLPWPGTLRNGRYSARTSASCEGHSVSRVATTLLGKQLGPPASGHAQHSGSAGGNGFAPWLLALVAIGGVGAGVGLGRVRSLKGRHSAPVTVGADTVQPRG